MSRVVRRVASAGVAVNGRAGAIAAGLAWAALPFRLSAEAGAAMDLWERFGMDVDRWVTPRTVVGLPSPGPVTMAGNAR